MLSYNMQLSLLYSFSIPCKYKQNVMRKTIIPSFHYRDNCALRFGYLFSLILTKETTMFTVLFRHAHSD